jgi:hypothetical protein
VKGSPTEGRYDRCETRLPTCWPNAHSLPSL